MVAPKKAAKPVAKPEPEKKTEWAREERGGVLRQTKKVSPKGPDFYGTIILTKPSVERVANDGTVRVSVWKKVYPGGKELLVVRCSDSEEVKAPIHEKDNQDDDIPWK